MRKAADFWWRFTVGGLLGSGAVLLRDATVSAWFIYDDDCNCSGKQRAPYHTFKVGENKVCELMPGNALIVKKMAIPWQVGAQERRGPFLKNLLQTRKRWKYLPGKNSVVYHLSKPVLESINKDLRIHLFSNKYWRGANGLCKGMAITWTNQGQRYLDGANDITMRNYRPLSIARQAGEDSSKDGTLRTFYRGFQPEQMVRSDILPWHVRSGEDTLVVNRWFTFRGELHERRVCRCWQGFTKKKRHCVSSVHRDATPIVRTRYGKLGEFIALEPHRILKEREMERAGCLYAKAKNFHEPAIAYENVVRMLKPFSTRRFW